MASVPRMAHIGFSSLLHNFAHLDLSLSVLRIARLESSILLPDSAMVGSLISTRSSAQVDLSLFAPGSEHLGLSPSAQSMVRSEPAVLVLGLSCTGFVSSLFVIDASTLGSPIPPRSFA